MGPKVRRNPSDKVPPAHNIFHELEADGVTDLKAFKASEMAYLKSHGPFSENLRLWESYDLGSYISRITKEYLSTGGGLGFWPPRASGSSTELSTEVDEFIRNKPE
jgi:hypothetical protein